MFILRLPNKYGGIVNLGKRRRKPFAVRVTVGYKNNRQVYKYLGYFEKRIEALEFLTTFNKSPYDIDAKKITLLELYNKWAPKHYEGLSAGSVKNYKSAFKRYEPLYSMPFSELRAVHLQQIIDNSPKGSALTTRAIAANLYAYALKNEIVDKDYSKLLDMPKHEKKARTVFTPEQVAKLWQHEGELCADIFLILLYSGMRINELFLLKSEDVDFNARVMIGGLKTKAGKDRTIPIHKKIEPILKKRIGAVYVLEGARGGRIYYTSFNKTLTDYLKALNMPHNAHEARHTFISQCDRLGLNNIAVKRIVGHAVKNVTEMYTHKNNEDLLQVIDAFNY